MRNIDIRSKIELLFTKPYGYGRFKAEPSSASNELTPKKSIFYKHVSKAKGTNLS